MTDRDRSHATRPGWEQILAEAERNGSSTRIVDLQSGPVRVQYRRVARVGLLGEGGQGGLPPVRRRPR